MPEDLFPDFLSSDDTLRIYEDDRLVFSSKKDRLLPLMDYLQGDGDGGRAVVIFDKIMGTTSRKPSPLSSGTTARTSARWSKCLSARPPTSSTWPSGPASRPAVKARPEG